MGLLARLLLEPGEPAYVEEPGFAGARNALEAAGAALIPVPLDAAGFSPERAEALAPGARLAVVTPAHHYPLGTVMPLPRRLALLAWAERAGGWVAEDDYDGEYRYGGRPLAPLRALDRAGRVAYLGSFSKLLFPALRLSHLVLPAALVDPAARLLAAGGPAEASLLGQGALGSVKNLGRYAASLASRPGEFHPQALLEPCLNHSVHTAPDVRPLTCSMRQGANRAGFARCIRANQSRAPFGRGRRRLNLFRAQRIR